MAEDAVSITALSEERLRLEREAFEIERSRLEAAIARTEAELKLARTGHPFLIFTSVMLFALVAFAGGVLLGVSMNENRHQRLREARLRDALSQLSGFTDVASATNTVKIPVTNNLPGTVSSRDVAVVVIQ